MEEPAFNAESAFWDQVADWILEAHGLEPGILTEAEIEALLQGASQRRA